MSSGGSKTKPVWPKWVKKPMKNALARAESLFQSHSAPPGLNPYTTQSLEMRAGLARDPNSVATQSADEAMRVLRGEYLDPTRNPNFNRSMQEAMGAASGRFAGSGRVGSGAYAGALGDAATGVAGQMYDNERQRMMQTLGLTPQLSAAKYYDASQLEDVGRAYEDESNRQFLWPYEQLDRFANLVYGSPAAQMPGQKTTNKFDWANAAVGAGTSAMMMCWVADELFGEGSEKAANARLYAMSHSSPFLTLYGWFGKSWAKWLKKNRWARPVVLPIWERMAQRGAEMRASYVG